jgi:Tol biopolymer transport system component/predicted Ser/Thr protein kinase
VTPERLQQIEDLYHSAREREPGQRAAFLAEACRGDEELREELDQLLASNSSSGNILDHPVVDLLAISTVAQLTTGVQIGPYSIEAALGAGGMGEVYRAVDTRLKRTVAIKVAKQDFGERFEREARAIAALNHPNICTLYDVGPNYLVMELIEGKPLKGPMALDQALQYATQICDALDAAHRKGITHRDLKPGNILVTKQGIKLLDFGLARMAPGENDPTLTRPGVVMGTPAYMAPEQREGKPGDARSDIYAFGCVLYEMLTGKRAAQERTAVEPAALEAVLGTCLEKDPEDRWQSARELKHALGWVVGQARGLQSTGHGAVPARRSYVTLVAAALAVVVAGAGVSYVAYRTLRSAEPKPLVRLDVDLGPDVSLDSSIGQDAIISPDGMRLVYASQSRLFTRRLDQPKATELAGTEGAYAPFFSPDGQWVAFSIQERLKKISVEGGAAVDLCDVQFGGGGSWGEDGNIIASHRGVLSRISSGGGTPTPAIKQAQGETNRFPQVLPGGKAVLFTSNATGSAWDEASIDVVSFADRRRKTLQRGGTYGRYVPSSNSRDGHLIYVNRGTLFAVPFDLETLAVRGMPSPVQEQVSYSPSFGHAQFDFSKKGTLVYRSGGAAGELLTVQWLDSTGKMQPLLTKPDAYQSARLSRDGQRLAISTTDLWVYELQRNTMTPLTFGGSLGSNTAPAVWSPDGRYLIFRKLGEGLFWTRSDGAGKPQLLAQSTDEVSPWSFTPDGKQLAFQQPNAVTRHDLWTMPLESDGAGLRGGKPEIFLGTQFNETNPSFSPDGHWLAYTSNEGGTDQIFVRSFPDKGGPWQVSDSGGSYPEWSRTARELFFRTADNRIAVAAYTVRGDTFEAHKPRVWSEKRPAKTFFNGSNYNLAPDGKRIVVLIPAEASQAQEAPNHIIFLQNFFDELRRKAPASK